ncbi:(deoxy)nucleoside triphosphate pyrophosphohydrolase [Dethiobacter alkaliphilus]|uniref:8-oxo-dGTP diphosphatase n=1 Tax=Dethiobacter alkaliphilus AHT 1 TaxID=555088 RepID=C0GD44_DETAL|nr:(deoxy)nucleoside triphosphate pyrophosphohydrolase [Dethiobacter alkaliphilus]EEG79129.1 NUDIX hydrolase [Dethiobacter alkaliphilus AHT 1]
MIDVVAAILENHQGQVLIAKRKQGKKMAGFWEFPGGKVEAGESPEQSLIRELNEEMNIEIEIGDYVGENVHFYQEGPIKLLAYKCSVKAGDIKLTDHDRYVWINVEDLNKVRLAPADVPFIEMLSDSN